MKSAILLSLQQLDLSRMSAVHSDAGSANLRSPQRLVEEDDCGWFAVELNEGLAEEFSDAERPAVGQTIPVPIFVQLEFNNSSAADLAIKLILVAATTLLDNERGLLCPIEDVHQRIRAGMEWQTSSV